MCTTPQCTHVLGQSFASCHLQPVTCRQQFWLCLHCAHFVVWLLLCVWAMQSVWSLQLLTCMWADNGSSRLMGMLQELPGKPSWPTLPMPRLPSSHACATHWLYEYVVKGKIKSCNIDHCKIDDCDPHEQQPEPVSGQVLTSHLSSHKLFAVVLTCVVHTTRGEQFTHLRSLRIPLEGPVSCLGSFLTQADLALYTRSKKECLMLKSHDMSLGFMTMAEYMH